MPRALGLLPFQTIGLVLLGDLALTCVLFGGGLSYLQTEAAAARSPLDQEGLMFAALAISLPLALRDRWPLAAWRSAFLLVPLGTVVSQFLHEVPYTAAASVTYTLVVYAAAVRCERHIAVGVASVARDDQALIGHERYWRSHGFGELTETAKTRREVLARLLPKLKIASRVELTDRFLLVRGDLKTYKIHLGSANILMEPNDAYLCIVPASGRAAGSVFLPFEDDGGTLSVILSKAFLLADDTAITDPTITRQLG